MTYQVFWLLLYLLVDFVCSVRRTFQYGNEFAVFTHFFPHAHDERFTILTKRLALTGNDGD